MHVKGSGPNKGFNFLAEKVDVVDTEVGRIIAVVQQRMRNDLMRVRCRGGGNWQVGESVGS
jgi:hypothetical protein